MLKAHPTSWEAREREGRQRKREIKRRRRHDEHFCFLLQSPGEEPMLRELAQASDNNQDDIYFSSGLMGLPLASGAPGVGLDPFRC